MPRAVADIMCRYLRVDVSWTAIGQTGGAPTASRITRVGGHDIALYGRRLLSGLTTDGCGTCFGPLVTDFECMVTGGNVATLHSKLLPAVVREVRLATHGILCELALPSCCSLWGLPCSPCRTADNYCSPPIVDHMTTSCDWEGSSDVHPLKCATLTSPSFTACR